MTDRMDQLKLQMELQMETNMERMRSSMMEEGKELGRKPTPTELFVHTHTRKHDKETFVDQKSKEIHDAIVARREELTQITPDNIDENQLYLDVVGGGEKRRKMYGLGSESSTFYPSIGASSSQAFSSSSSQNAALQQQIKQLEKQLENERQAMTDRMDQLKLQMELQMETNIERMRSSMMEEVMRLVRGLPTPSSP
ncbi:uncharacterized protein LOC110648240 [Hevea brasiliensis]|uniref:uncharacterized protein LOC110648240 n=1 Tax=Hevea brasiliensis TaxID=3981 RepID=UPI0025CCD814|nr:uncharacterized protein LOC110648240 [Hevea brasiliensis]